MTYVVTETCIRCKYTDCVDVCPVDCFREGPNFLVIDPDECIDCTLCVAECPVEAIYAEDDVPADQEEFKAINAELAEAVEADHRAQAGARATPTSGRACRGKRELPRALTPGPRPWWRAGSSWLSIFRPTSRAISRCGLRLTSGGANP